MRVAQQLYEGVEVGEEGPTGLITYMRTDSFRVNPAAREEARAFIGSEYGEEYVVGQLALERLTEPDDLTPLAVFWRAAWPTTPRAPRST